MKKIIFLITVIGLFFYFGVINAQAENVGFVTRQGGGLVLNGQPYYFASNNSYCLFYETQAVANEVLEDASALGLNVMRTWGSCEGEGPMGYSFQPTPGVYDEATFQKMDYIIWKANLCNVRLIIPLVNNWDDNFGGINQYVEWSPTANTHDQFFTDQWCRDAYRAYVNYFLNRVNTLTGVAYKNDPTIMILELANEARCSSDPTGNTLQAWVEEMSAYIKSIDTNHLVSTGSEGWYADNPDQDPVTWTGVNYISNNQCPNIDICSYHLFSDQYGLTEPGTTTFIQSHIFDAHNTINKPVYLGEFGKKANRQALPFQGTEILHDFTTDTEGWFNLGNGFNWPVRVAEPSYNGNGALDYLTNGTIGPGNPESQGQGEKQYAAPYLDCSGYGDISAWVYVPTNAPNTLKADMYLHTGDSWQWYDGLDKVLIPGQWNQISISTENVANLNSVRAMGIRTFAFEEVYNGDVYYDLVEGVIGNLVSYPAQLAERNTYYTNVYNLIDTSDGNGAGFWVLLSDGYIDGDDYGVYYPLDASTVPIIADFARRMEEKSGTSFLWDGCDVVGNWYPNTITSDAVAVSLNSQFVTQGRYSLKLDYEINGFGKAFIENAGINQTGLNENWASRDNLVFDLYNPGGPTTADVGISSGSDWAWHESLPQNLTTGWNRISVDFTSSTWKSAATGWQYTGTIANLNQVKGLSIGVFGYTAPGSFYVDNILLDVPMIDITYPPNGGIVPTLTPTITWDTLAIPTNENLVLVINRRRVTIPNTGSYLVPEGILAPNVNYTLKLFKETDPQVNDAVRFRTQLLLPFKNLSFL